MTCHIAQNTTTGSVRVGRHRQDPSLYINWPIYLLGIEVSLLIIPNNIFILKGSVVANRAGHYMC